MTDSNPFVPPGGPPSSAPPVAPPPSAASSPPPPSGPMWTGGAPAPAPTRPPTPQWVKGLILAGIIVGAAAVIGVVGLLAGAVRSVLEYEPPPAAQDPTGTSPAAQEAPSGAPEPLLAGDPGQPVAAEPLDCTGCFDLEDAVALALPESAYVDLGVPRSDGRTGDIKLYSEQLYNIRSWREEGIEPEHCYLTYPWAPLPVVAEPVPTDVRLQDLYYPEWHDDGSDLHVLGEAVRVFGSSDGAVTHLAEVAAARDSCSGYTSTVFDYSGVVTAAPALDLPASVAATGWVEQSGIWRQYTFDVQRGNLVARLVLTTNGAGPREADFRRLVEDYAVMLAALDPRANEI